MSARKTQASTTRTPYQTQDSSKKYENNLTLESARSPDGKNSARILSPDNYISITQNTAEEAEGPATIEIARNDEGAPTPVPEEEEEFSYDYEEVDEEYDEEDV